MKRNRFLVICLICFTFTSCFDFKNLFKKDPKTEIKNEEPPVEISTQTPVPVEEKPEPVVIEKPVQPVEVEDTEDDEEYLRSINNLENKSDVSKSDFSEDKKRILQIISELSEVMESKDVNKWIKYIEPASLEYYGNPVNLRKAQKKLPNRTILLKSISDYFNYVFIPSRKRSQVDEIRYISKTNIKAVQVKEDKSIVVYYYFTKIDGKWLVHLPEIY